MLTQKWEASLDTHSTIVMGKDIDDARDAAICSLFTRVWLDDYDHRRMKPDSHTADYLNLYTRIGVSPMTSPLSLVKGRGVATDSDI